VQLQAGVFPVQLSEYSRVVEVWEASVRATHYFVAEADIQFFKPMVRDVLPLLTLVCMRDTVGTLAGFIAVAHGKVEMLFIHPDWRGQGIGRKLLTYAVTSLGATLVDVNEQNEQALGFYHHMGFEVIGRSEIDGTGKPCPILHMRLENNLSVDV
jgi:putative acetyltransferase